MTNQRINQLEEAIKELSKRVINGDRLKDEEMNRLQYYAEEYHRETGEYCKIE